MATFTPIARGEIVNANTFNSRLTELSSSISGALYSIEKALGFIDLSGLSTYTISAIPSDVRYLRIMALLRSNGAGIASFNVNSYALFYRRKTVTNQNAQTYADDSGKIDLINTVSTDGAGEFGINEFTIYAHTALQNLFVSTAYNSALNDFITTNARRGTSAPNNIITSITLSMSASTFATGSGFNLYYVRA